MSQKIVFLDTETGDRDPKDGDLLTVYMAITDEEYKILDELDLKLKPNDRLPIANIEALNVNGIDLKAHLEDPNTITYAQAKKLIIEFYNKHYKKIGRYSNLKVCAYNSNFDLSFIYHYLMSKKEWEEYIHYNTLDAMQPVIWLKEWGWFPKTVGSLTSLIEYLDVPKRKAHGAKEDTLMMIDAMKKLKEIMISKKENGSTSDLISLLEME